MTNVSASHEKVSTRAFLFQAALGAIENQGWTVERIARSGKSSVRRITKGKITKTVSIRTSQDTWIAFLRNSTGTGWSTLDDVDYVVAASVDDRHQPRFAQIHMIDADEVRDRFNRAYIARKQANHALPENRGIWISLYEKESNDPVSLIGAGAGLKHAPIARVPLDNQQTDDAVPDSKEEDAQNTAQEDATLTIAEAKRRLALAFGVNESDVKITING